MSMQGIFGRREVDVPQKSRYYPNQVTHMIEQQLLDFIKQAIDDDEYAIRSHAVQHAVEEGFTEESIVEAIQNAKILEWYEEEQRCLLVGRFQITFKMKEYLHIVVDYWIEDTESQWIDIVTAYIPRRPHWETSTRRGKKR